ncbi:TIGR03905 family TSCPD domain-containing protein [Alkalicella caledoniensis]|uniref:ribonucleoside-diphosphate reductase n=1 Tax=Alkalicella caledoniensis TaxID=2731377 RepID=A0A7G9WD98_ALKCA|nr:TIGR03905 family TSCPD domain-containing protein [Alkalicella caledoniensis]QNO16660.1 TIGR03905 family TSCPD domain-containing protein [Alkalicella caledoniensis]
MRFKTEGTCAKEIIFKISNGIVEKVEFVNGCAGNVQGIAKLVEGRPVDEIIDRLSGIECRNGTSCPDQLAKALKGATA